MTRLALVLGVVGLAGCGASTASLRANVAEAVGTQVRFERVCRGVAGTNAGLTFADAGPHAFQRLLTEVTGKGERGNPLQRGLDQITDAEGELQRAKGSPAASAPDLAEVLTHFQEVKRDVDDLKKTFDQATDIARSFLDVAEHGKAIAMVQQCAVHALNAPTDSTGCTRTLGTLTSTVTDRVLGPKADLTEKIDTLLRDLELLQSAVRSLERSRTTDQAAAVRKAKLAMEEALAFAGLAKDAEHILDILSDKDGGRAMTRLLIWYAGDGALDSLLGTIQGVVARLEKEIDLLDEHSWGGASLAVDFGLSLETSKSLFRRLARDVGALLEEAGFDRGALGDAVCRSMRRREESGAQHSRLLQKLYEAMLGEDDVPVGVAQLTSETASALARSDLPLAEDTDAIASAAWLARMTVADSVLARPVLVGDVAGSLPTWSNVSPSLVAGYVTELRREPELIDRTSDVESLQRIAIQVLTGPYGAVPAVVGVMCGEQQMALEAAASGRLLSVSAACQSARLSPTAESGELASSVRQVAWELCGANAAREFETTSQVLCNALNPAIPTTSDGIRCSVDHGVAWISIPNAFLDPEAIPTTCKESEKEGVRKNGESAACEIMRIKGALRAGLGASLGSVKLRITGYSSRPWRAKWSEYLSCGPGTCAHPEYQPVFESDAFKRKTVGLTFGGEFTPGRAQDLWNQAASLQVSGLDGDALGGRRANAKLAVLRAVAAAKLLSDLCDQGVECELQAVAGVEADPATYPAARTSSASERGRTQAVAIQVLQHPGSSCEGLETPGRINDRPRPEPR